MYLQDIGNSALQISYLAAVMMVTKVVAPSFWSWIIQHHISRMSAIRWGALLAVLAFTYIFIDTSFWAIAGVIAAYSFFWNAILPQFEVITLGHLGDKHALYSRVRLWGSIGFVIPVACLGFIFDLISLRWLPHILATFLLLMWLTSLLIPKPISENNKTEESVLWTLKNRVIWSFILVNVLLQIAHGPYYTFYSIYMEQFGYSRAAIGGLWSLGVMAEIMLFAFMHKVWGRFSLRGVVLFSLALTTARWLMIALMPTSVPLMIAAQLIHALSYGSMHAAAVEFVRRQLPESVQGGGMALYFGVAFGVGGAIGALLSGYLWQYNPASIFLMAAACSALAWLLSCYGLHLQPAHSLKR